MASFAEAVQVGDWRVEPELDLVARNGHSTKIEPRAMRVLLCLIRRAGHVVTVQELLDEVWPDVVVGPDSIYQAIALLRRALGDDRHHPAYIAHVPRRGYRLIAPVRAAPMQAVAVAPIRAIDAAPTQTVSTPSTTAAAATSATHSRRPHPGALAWAAVFAVAIATLGVLYLYVRGTPSASLVPRAARIDPSPRENPSVPSVPSIAVLPFVDMSEKQDLGYVADGLTEELIDLLSRGSDMRVPARTSSFYFKNKTATVGTIASALGVGHLLEGSVRRSGNRLRVTAQLIRGDNGYHLWSQTYDRELTDIFAVEDEIAGAVARTLQAQLRTPRRRDGAAMAGIEAHNLLLECHLYLQRNTPTDELKAVGCYHRAVALAPLDAAAWAGYADALWRKRSLASSSPLEDQKCAAEARQAAQHALALDPGLAAAHAVLGVYHRVIDRDWSAAQDEVNAALASDPDDSSSLLAAARLAMTLGQSDKALAFLERAQLRDPLNFLPYARMSEIYLYQGKLGEAEAAARRRLDLSPEGGGGYLSLADVLLAQGKPRAALEAVRQESGQAGRMVGLALVYHALGKPAAADAALQELARTYPGTALELAEIYTYRGEADRALAVLERALASGDPTLNEIKSDSYLKPLHADPRYQGLLRRLNLPPG